MLIFPRLSYESDVISIEKNRFYDNLHVMLPETIKFTSSCKLFDTFYSNF
jgi:hypothetical protein